MRIAMFGMDHPISRPALETLASEGHTLLLVTPEPRLRSRIKRTVLRRWPPVESYARQAGIARAYFGSDAGARAIGRFQPDLISIAAFPKLVPGEIVRMARLGAINLHPAALPRHRGPNPLFWIYHDGDAETALTVHRVTSRFDAGPIILQEPLAVPRGYPLKSLIDDMVAQSGPTLVKAIAALADGASEWAQDESLASKAPRVDLRTFRAPIEQWDVAHSWHFLRSLAGVYRLPLKDSEGQALAYKEVGDFVLSADTVPGTIERGDKGWILHCNGGLIELTP